MLISSSTASNRSRLYCAAEWRAATGNPVACINVKEIAHVFRFPTTVRVSSSCSRVRSVRETMPDLQRWIFATLLLTHAVLETHQVEERGEWWIRWFDNYDILSVLCSLQKYNIFLKIFTIIRSADRLCCCVNYCVLLRIIRTGC
jgi:hypothetical protein